MQAKSAPTAVPKRNTRAFVSKYKSAIIVMIGSFILAVILATKAGPSSLFNTLVTGGMWALLAVGLSLVFGVMNVAHFAHGESFMVGAFIGYFVFTPISKYLKRSPNEFLSLIAPFFGIIAAALVGLVLGYLLERLLFRPLRGRSKSGWVMNTFLVTVGLSFVMINGTTLLLGPNFRGVPRYWSMSADRDVRDPHGGRPAGGLRSRHAHDRRPVALPAENPHRPRHPGGVAG